MFWGFVIVFMGFCLLDCFYDETRALLFARSTNMKGTISFSFQCIIALFLLHTKFALRM